MAGPVTIRLVCDETSVQAASAALVSLGLSLRAHPRLVDLLGDQFADVIDLDALECGDVGDEALREILIGRIEMPAGWAGDATVRFHPPDRLRELVGAVASEINVPVVDVHGWPVLFVGGSNPTVAEAGGVNNPASGGLVIGGQA